MSDKPQTTEWPPGFYWVQHEPYEGRAQRPLVAELSDMGNWYICGVEGREDPARFKVLSGPLPPPENSGPQTTLEDEVRDHFNEPVLAIRGLGRIIGYSEDESDCYIIIRHLNGEEIHHSMVGGYYWLNRLRGQNYVKSVDGEDWDDLVRLDSILERNGSPKAPAFRCERYVPEARE